MKNILIKTACLMSLSTSVCSANSEPVIFGTVTQKNGNEVTGTIRWGDQEMFLSDIFNGRKIDTVGIGHMSDDEKDQLLDQQPGPQAQIGDIKITFKSFFGKEIKPPYFNVFFGSIKQIDIANDVVIATLHDGTKISGDDGSNDLNDEIYVKTTEGEVQEFDLDELTNVTFSQAPEEAKTFADGIYGTVTSSLGTFEGRIMWDKDERGTDEKLDGEDENQEYNIKFGDIVSIEKTESGNASKVLLRDQKSLILTGTNDVNDGNRGIWIDNPNTGRVEIDWDQFEKLAISEVNVKWHDFSDYQQMSKPLAGQVKLKDGSEITADKLVFDMNQESLSELLYADIGGNNRQVPLAKFKSIKHINDSSVELQTHDSNKLIAYNNNSVTRANKGVLVTTNENHKWYPWAEVELIVFK